jgi:hypothetical protein
MDLNWRKDLNFNMIEHIIYTIIFAIIFSLLEIQVEGKAGWARHLPTFRINVFFNKLLGGKPLTGYHIYMIILFIAIFHAMLHEDMLCWNKEFQIFGLLSWFFVLEDVLWFILNPHYTLKKFKKEYIEWHKRWVFKLPATYWWGMIIGTALLILGRRN